MPATSAAAVTNSTQPCTSTRMTASDDDSLTTGTYWVQPPGWTSSWYPNQKNTRPSRIRPAVGAHSALSVAACSAIRAAGHEA